MPGEMVNVVVGSAFLDFTPQNPLALIAASFQHAHGGDIRRQCRSVELSKVSTVEAVLSHLRKCRGRDALTPVVFTDPIADLSEMLPPSALGSDTDVADKHPLIFDHTSNTAVLF